MKKKRTEEDNDDLRKELESMYTPIEEAKKEIWRRWNDKELRKKIDDFLKNDIPDIFKISPRAVLARQVASPNFEAIRFLDLSRELNLKSLYLEYLSDKFVAGNIDKYYLCRLFFHRGNIRDKNHVATTLKMVDICDAEGKCMDTLKTIHDKNLVEFHHELINPLNLFFDADIFDISKHYERNGLVAERYYTYFFSLYICYGVLVENYLLDDKQTAFTRDIVLPNFRKVSELFGLKPLVVHLGPSGEEENLYWRYYPTSIEGEIKKQIKGIKKKILIK